MVGVKNVEKYSLRKGGGIERWWESGFCQVMAGDTYLGLVLIWSDNTIRLKLGLARVGQSLNKMFGK